MVGSKFYSKKLAMLIYNSKWVSLGPFDCYMTVIFVDKNLSAMLEIVINVCFAGAMVACR